MSFVRRLPRKLIRLFGGMLVHLIYRIDTVHAERIPEQGGALLLPNHVTFVDGFLISACCKRPVRFVMDEAFTASRAVRVFARIFETVTIRRDQPREAIRVTIEALKNGDLVCLFPEGQLTRTGTLCELRRGFELIAKKAGHPLIPLWIDGSWGSIFSYERGRFFHKLPYKVPYPLTVSFGAEIPPKMADMETVRQGLLVAAAAALDRRFRSLRWGKRIPPGDRAQVGLFGNSGAVARRRMWINGHQVGQINALQRKERFFVLESDPLPGTLVGLALTFPALFGAELRSCPAMDGTHAASWVGGEKLRKAIGSTQLCQEIDFYDFGPRALEPVYRAGLRHCPCLAVDGMVVAMSMPDPPKGTAGGETQPGHKSGTWGKLLPGWYLLRSDNGNFRAHGPAAPDIGLELPAGCHLDPEGFLTPFAKPTRHR